MSAKTNILTAVCIGLIAVQTALSAAEPVGVLLQKGIYAEETEGDLEAAITIYRGIVDQARQDQSLVAQALYRLGGCYRKQGLNAEAASAYQLILKQFPEDPEWLLRARDELSALGLPASGVVLRQVWTRPKYSLRPSPDGRQVTWIDYEGGGDLMLRDLATGVDRNLTHKSADTEQLAFECAFSRDGKRIAYGWAKGDQSRVSIELKTIDLSDLSHRVLYRGERLIRTDDWSPDGRHLAVLRFPDPQSNDAHYTLSLISTTDGTERELGAWADQMPQDVRFSPDGRYLAYNAQTQPRSLTNHIMITDLQEGTHHRVDDGMNRQHFLGWRPDGRGILFRSDRRGSTDLWQVEVKDAQVSGQPELLKSDLGEIEPVGMDLKGDLFYAASVSIEDIHIATMDLASGRLLAPPRLVDIPSAGSNGKPNLSPDGNYIIYRSGVKDPVACLLDLNTWELREFKDSRAWASGIGWWYLFPDNASLLVGGYDPVQEVNGFWILDIATDTITSIPLRHGELEYSLLPVRTDPERVFLLGQAGDPKRFEVVIYEVKTGDLIRCDSPVGAEDWRIWENGPWIPWISLDGYTLFSKRKVDSGNRYILTAHNLKTGQAKDLLETHVDFSVSLTTLDPEGREFDLAGFDAEAKRHIDWAFIYEDLTLKQVRDDHLPEGFQGIWGFRDINVMLLEKSGPKGNAEPREVWILQRETGKVVKSELTLAPYQRLFARLQPGSQHLMLRTTQPRERNLWVLENLFPVATSAKE